jgi:hypothetical protein
MCPHSAANASCRSIKPGKHYLPFWQKDRNDVLKLIEGLQQEEPLSAQAQHVIAERAQRFAAHFTTIKPRCALCCCSLAAVAAAARHCMRARSQRSRSLHMQLAG